MLEALATFGAALEAKKIRKKKLKMKVRIDKGIFFFSGSVRLNVFS